jgi:hypothetical protein
MTKETAENVVSVIKTMGGLAVLATVCWKFLNPGAEPLTVQDLMLVAGAWLATSPADGLGKLLAKGGDR